MRMNKEQFEKWSDSEKIRVSKLDNKSLLEDTIELASGDDYDGCMTTRGEVTFDLLREELFSRLKDWFGEEWH